MTKGRIEISQNVTIEASIHFWIDREEWEAMTDDQKREYIGDKIDSAAIRCSNDTIVIDGSVNMSASVSGPDNAAIDLAAVSIYDPEE